MKKTIKVESEQEAKKIEESKLSPPTGEDTPDDEEAVQKLLAELVPLT